MFLVLLDEPNAVILPSFYVEEGSMPEKHQIYVKPQPEGVTIYGECDGKLRGVINDLVDSLRYTGTTNTLAAANVILQPGATVDFATHINVVAMFEGSRIKEADRCIFHAIEHEAAIGNIAFSQVYSTRGTIESISGPSVVEHMREGSRINVVHDMSQVLYMDADSSIWLLSRFDRVLAMSDNSRVEIAKENTHIGSMRHNSSIGIAAGTVSVGVMRDNSIIHSYDGKVIRASDFV